MRCASASTGRWVRTGGERSGVFQLSGMTLGSRRVHRARWESGALALSRVGIDLQRRAEARLIEVREEMSLRAAIRLLCGRRTVSGGRHDSAARIRTGVDRKQLVTHLCTCRQWTSITRYLIHYRAFYSIQSVCPFVHNLSSPFLFLSLFS